MEVGTGIFLSSIFLGTVALFIFTKDRWNWKKIVSFPIIFFVVCVFVYFSYEKYESRPKKLDVMWGVSLGSTDSDVKFIKGNPSVIEDSYWVYFLDNDPHTVGYIVHFKDNRVRAVEFVGERFSIPTVNGINGYKELDEAEQILGAPTNISRSKDDLSRIYSFEQLGMYFKAEKGSIHSLGIYDPTKWDNGVIVYADDPQKS